MVWSAFRYAGQSRGAFVSECRVPTARFSTLPHSLGSSARSLPASHGPDRTTVPRRSVSRCFGEQDWTANGHTSGTHNSRTDSHGIEPNGFGGRRAAQTYIE